jgi:hypothetical protein
MVVIIRTAMIRSRRVDAAIAAASVFFETLTMMAVGAFLAAAVLAVGFRGEAPKFWGAVGLLLVAGLPTLPPVFQRLARLAGVGRSDPGVSLDLESLRFGTLLVGWLLMSLAWALLGLSYWATLEAMAIPGLDPIDELRATRRASRSPWWPASSCWSRPEESGVREAALVALMMPYLRTLTPHPELSAWASAAVLRLVWLGAEVAIAAVLYPMGMLPLRRRTQQSRR